MKTTLVNIKTGARCDVYIGRSKRPSEGMFGNPFEIGKDGTREEVIEKFKVYFYERLKLEPAFKKAVEGLRGKILGCFCVPLACHGQVIIDYLEKTFQRSR